MAITMCVIMLATLPCPSRGGHATLPPARGGHATPVLEDVGNVDNWVCIHNHEGAWNDPDDTYWGGLQMDREFMNTYGADMIRKYGGYADEWSPRDQMVVAQRAYKTRGYNPWPNTARMCGLL